jgi:outer membrane protein OmpA-like peptidoglycan-associated protein
LPKHSLYTPFMRAIYRLLGFLCSLTIVTICHAQSLDSTSEREVVSIGAYGGYGIATISGSFAIDGNGLFTPSTTCGKFETGSGNDLMFGAIAEMPLGNHWRIGLRPEFIQHTGTMRFRCVDPANTRLPNGTVTVALTDFVADITGSAVSIRLDAGWSPLKIPIEWFAGPVVSLPLSIRYRVWEEIVSPSSAEFVSGGQTREFGEGDFPGTSVAVSLLGGMRYRAPISRKLTLLPEVSYRQALMAEAPDMALKFSAVQGTLGLVYRFDESESTLPPPPPPVVATRQPATLKLALSLYSSNSEGKRSDTLYVRRNQTIITEVHPLLNYIFFDSASGNIPDRYRQREGAGIASFGETNIHSTNNLDIYYNVLDIIGSRLRSFPGSVVTLTGTQPDNSPGPDGQADLAEQRARNVADYLRDRWGIEPRRITVESRQMPTTPSNPDKPEGAQENRRVEIATNDPRVIAPVLLSDTVRHFNAAEIEIAPQVATTEGIDRWEAKVISGRETLDVLSGVGAPPQTIQWGADSTDALAHAIGKALTVDYTVVDRAGQTRSALAELPVRPIASGDSLQYGAGFYSLILFDFGRSILSPAHLRTIDLVNDRTTPTVRAHVFGFTDRLGEESRNLQLSADRANAVAKHLKANVVEIVGRGINTELYDNSLPEGRFYSRSVTIETE